ncbi:GNAT family N-acetyltransferase [Vreelandella rituensis]|uniref:GNAT family N-acetyltransferase n=1 Tax=Vreelandella rituensis TaxID=2282306 RepID=A0A368U9P8_9GAMM|nr:GNAT family N-acetyltransferase [Halomonas rituensis]RCV93675.1 GNAT family N-acetyltransferase [Halomonas rituensis]
MSLPFDGGKTRTPAGEQPHAGLETAPAGERPPLERLSPQGLSASLREQYPGLKLDLGGSKEVITLGRIVIPEDQRNQGLGTAVMATVMAWADQQGKTLALSPTTDFGGSKARLKAFYQGLGFIENKGRHKDYAISETLYRRPGTGVLGH